MPEVRSRSRSGWERWSWSAPVVAPLLVFWRGLTGSLLLAPGDGYNYYLPLHLHAARLWREGVVPAWNSLAFSGSALLALNQPAVFYPPNLLFLVLPVATANNLVVVANYIVAGLGAYFLARRITGDPVAAAGAGLAFGLSGFMVGHLGHQAIIASASWLPWTLLGLELLIERVTPWRLLAGGGALALAVVAGHGQMFSINAFALVVYAGARALLDRSWRPMLAVGGLGLAGVALAAVQLLPTALIIGETDRSRLSFEEAVTYSFSASHLPLLVFPYLFGNIVQLGPFTEPYQGEWAMTELTGYVGAAAAVLAGAAVFTAVVGRRDSRVLAMAVTGLAAVIVAAGDATPASHAVHAAPVFGQFRNWGRFVVVLDLVVAVLAACGLAHLRAGGREGMRAARAAATAAVLLALAALTLPRFAPVAAHAVSGRHRLWALALPAAFAVVAAAGAFAVARLGGRRAPLAAAGLVFLVGLDMAASFGWFYEWRAGHVTPRRLAADLADEHVEIGPVPDAGGGIDRYLAGGVEVAAIPDYANISMLHRQPSANGFDPLAPERYLDTVGGMLYYGGVTRPDDLWRDGSDLLDLLRVSLVVTQEDTAAHQAMPSGRQQTVVDRDGSPDIIGVRHRPRLPEAFVVGSVESAGAESIRSALAGLTPFEPADAALLEEPCPACEALDRPGPAGEARVRRWHDGRMTVAVQADRPGVLVVSEAYLPGWSAHVDGGGVQVLRANGILVGVPVPEGTSTVELTYEAPGLKAGAAITITALAGLMVAAGAHRRRQGQPEPQPAERSGGGGGPDDVPASPRGLGPTRGAADASS